MAKPSSVPKIVRLATEAIDADDFPAPATHRQAGVRHCDCTFTAHQPVYYPMQAERQL
jgi:hypothetical protein